MRLSCAFASGTRAFPVHRDAVRAKAGLGCRGGVGTRRWCSKHAIGVTLGVRGLGLVAARKVFDEMPKRAGHVASATMRLCSCPGGRGKSRFHYGCACACRGVGKRATLGGFHERARRAWPWQGHGVATAVVQCHEDKRWRSAGWNAARWVPASGKDRTGCYGFLQTVHRHVAGSTQGLERRLGKATYRFRLGTTRTTQ